MGGYDLALGRTVGAARGGPLQPTVVRLVRWSGEGGVTTGRKVTAGRGAPGNRQRSCSGRIGASDTRQLCAARHRGMRSAEHSAGGRRRGHFMTVDYAISTVRVVHSTTSSSITSCSSSRRGRVVRSSAASSREDSRPELTRGIAAAGSRPPRGPWVGLVRPGLLPPWHSWALGVRPCVVSTS
jgi:hypothetical protein